MLAGLKRKHMATEKKSAWVEGHKPASKLPVRSFIPDMRKCSQEAKALSH